MSPCVRISLVTTLLIAQVGGALASPGETALVSAKDPGSPTVVGNAMSNSNASTISEDGRFVAFWSRASNLVPSDSNGADDIFLRDTRNGVTVRVSVDSNGAQANGQSSIPAISADGRRIAFSSLADNLIAQDANSRRDIFLRDVSTSSTTLISRSSNGEQGNGLSASPFVSASGSHVAFYSDATNLVPGDTNGWGDLFVHHVETGTTSRVSLASNGAQANNLSFQPSISGDGRYIAFASRATNLVTGDSNDMEDIFVRDTLSGTTTRVSVNSTGAESNGNSGNPFISVDGRYVVFDSAASNLVTGDTNDANDVFLHDRQTRSTIRVSLNSGNEQVNGHSTNPVIDADARRVAFVSAASTLAVDDTNGTFDVFVRDLVADTTARISIASNGAEADGTSHGPSISAGGSHVAFFSYADNLVPGDSNGVQDVFVHTIDRRVTGIVSAPTNLQVSGNQGSSTSAFSTSADGRYVSFYSRADNIVPNDTNGVEDVFVRDMETGVTSRVSVDSSGVAGNGFSARPAISADGRFVAFHSQATNLVFPDTNGTWDIFLRDTLTGTTSRVSDLPDGSQSSGLSLNPSISGDGRYVAFRSDAANLVPGDGNGVSDIFVHDRQSNTTIRVSVSTTGSEGNAESFRPAISANGRFVAFYSAASNLVENDTNGVSDIFVRDIQSGTTTRVSISTSGAEANAESTPEPVISADGRYIAFASRAGNLVPGDLNGAYDVFLRDTLLATTQIISQNSGGEIANRDSSSPSISGDGRFVAFGSIASNLDPEEVDGSRDVFIRDLVAGTTKEISVNSAGEDGNSFSDVPSISSDGRFVAFASRASNFVDGDLNNVDDVFRHELAPAEDAVTGVLPTSVLAVGGNTSRREAIADSLNGQQDLLTYWSVSGDLSQTWFTIDLGAERLLSELGIAPRDDNNFLLSIHVGNTLTGNRVDSAPVATCQFAGNGSAQPLALTTCSLPDGTRGRYITVQGDRRWLRIYGFEARGQVFGGGDENSEPTARFTATISNDPFTVLLDAGTSSDDDGTIVSYDWTFGDGQTGSGAELSHTYANSGTFSIRLTVTDDDGAVSTSTRDLLVRDDGEDNNGGDAKLIVSLFAAGGGSSESRANILDEYIADGSQVLNTFWSTNGDQSRTWFTVDLGSEQPVSEIRVAPRDDQSFVLSVTVSSDVNAGKADGEVDALCELPAVGSTTPAALRACAMPSGTTGRYITVQGNRAWIRIYGFEAYSQSGGDGNASPTASFTTNVQTPPFEISFNASASRDSDGVIVSYTWDFGDGTSESGIEVVHTYNAPGVYQVTLTITDDLGATDRSLVDVVVTDGSSSSKLPVSVAAVGGSQNHQANLIDEVPASGQQNLETFWSTSGGQQFAWLTLDLGQPQSVENLRIAPRNDQTYALSITVSETMVNGRAQGPVTIVCDTPNGGSIAPETLRDCVMPAGTLGQFITVQSNRNWLRVYGTEVLGR